jgi:hypothetical protein
MVQYRIRASPQTRYVGSSLINAAPQRLAITDQDVYRFGIAGLGPHPVLEKALKALHLQLSEQQPECGIGWRLGTMGAEQLVQGIAMTLLLRRSLAAACATSQTFTMNTDAATPGMGVWPPGAGLQGQAPNHPMLLRSKGAVVSDGEKADVIR